MPESIEKRCDEVITNFGRTAYRHALLAGAEANVDKADPGAFEAWHQNTRVAHSHLAMVMVLRRIREAAPELLPAVIDQIDLANLIGEMGLHVQLHRYLAEVGCDTEDLDRVHYLPKRSDAA